MRSWQSYSDEVCLPWPASVNPLEFHFRLPVPLIDAPASSSMRCQTFQHVHCRVISSRVALLSPCPSHSDSFRPAPGVRSMTHVDWQPLRVVDLHWRIVNQRELLRLWIGDLAVQITENLTEKYPGQDLTRLEDSP